MNYIKKLQHTIRVERTYSEALLEGLDEIVYYLNLPKFLDDPMVNKQDIINRIYLARQSAVVTASQVGDDTNEDS
jgi:hypothetical protein